MECYDRSTDDTANAALRDGSPLVSVIIPTHNRLAETMRAVESARRQSLVDIEIIVVDDGSQHPQELELRLDGLRDSRISFVAISPNRGANHARNCGVSCARGDFIAFLDSDDEWLPDKLRAQVARIEFDRESAVCSCQAIALSTVGDRVISTTIPLRLIRPDDRLDEYLFCRRGAMVTPSLLLSRELALRTPFDESLRRHQDFGFLLRLAASGASFVFVEEPLVIVHWESLASSGRHIQPGVSSEFLERYGELMSGTAKCGFWCRNVVVPLFIAGRYRDGVRALVKQRGFIVHLVLMPRLAVQIGVLLLGVPPHIVQIAPQVIRRRLRTLGGRPSNAG